MESNVSTLLGLPAREAPLRSTYMKDLEKCPRLFLLQDRVGIHRVGYDRALDFGTLVHRFLQSMFLGRGEAVAKQDCQMLYDQTCDRLKEVSTGGLLPGGASMKDTLQEADTNLWKAIAAGLLFWELNPFPADQYQVVEGPNGPMVECLVEGGAVDLVLVNRAKETWIVDHKTTSIQPTIRASALTISPQFQLYKRGVESYLSRPVTGVICNIIRTPSIKYCPDSKDKDEKFPGYLKRLRKWYETDDGGGPQMLQVFHRFGNDPLTEQEIDHKIGNYKLASALEPSLPLFPRAGDYTCHEFNRSCPLLPFCTSDPATWRARLQQPGWEIRHREDEETTDGR